MLLKDYYLEKGFKREWFNDLEDAVTVDTDIGLFSFFFSFFLNKHEAIEYLRKCQCVVPFQTTNRKKGRKLFFKDIFIENKTKFKISDDMKPQENDYFIPFKNHSFEYDTFYIYDFDARICDEHHSILKKDNKIVVVNNVLFSYINKIEIENLNKV